MKHGWRLGMALALGVAAEAAEPPVPASSSGPAAVIPVPPAPKPVESSIPPTLTKRPPLDLRIRDVRNYMTPNEYRAALGAPDADKDAIVVEANRVLLPMKFEQPIPSGMPLLPLWWAATHPTQSWRILVPDLNRPPDGPTVDKVPPPVFRWGP